MVEKLVLKKVVLKDSKTAERLVIEMAGNLEYMLVETMAEWMVKQPVEALVGLKGNEKAVKKAELLEF
jgi:hypothetical protein